MKPLQAAQAEVLDAVAPLPVMELALREAGGLVLAEPVVASHDLPPFANSAMDGYAVRAADVSTVPVTLTVTEDVPAGSVPRVAVRAGTATKIMTGAPLPEGADAVVKVEDTEPRDGEVLVNASVAAGTAVRPAGGDVTAGTRVLEAGVRLGPSHLGLLSSLGVAWPNVRKRPVAAVLSTGDEVVPPEVQTLAPGKIRDSNRFILRRLLEELGATMLDYGIVGDDAGLLNQTLGHAAREADLVLTSGGVSMGEYDLVKQVLARLGTVDFWKVAMQPAKPFAFGMVGDTPLFGLPGNPVSVFVAFEQFVRPAVLSMMGADRLFRQRIVGRLAEPVATDPAKTVFLRMTTESGPNGPDGARWARLSGGQGSNVLSAMAASDAFGVVPIGTSDLAMGDPIELEMFLLPETRTREEALND